MSVALSAIFIQYIYIYIYFRNCLDSKIRKQQSCFLLFYLRNCAVNEKEHHNSSTSKRSRRSSRWKEEEEQHKEPIAEDFENSCSLYIYATQLSSQALRPTEQNATLRCSYQLTNGILGWLQLSSIIVGPLSLPMYLGNEQMYLTVSLNENGRFELLFKFILKGDLNINFKRTKDIMKWCKYI